jgi:hypothetical protein
MLVRVQVFIRKEVRLLKRGASFIVLQVVLTAIALVLQVGGIFLSPLYLSPDLHRSDLTYVGPYNDFPIYGYESPLILLSFIASSVLIVFCMSIKVSRLRRDIGVNDSAVLAFSTVLFILPVWNIMWASQVSLNSELMWSLNPYIRLLQGFYIYAAGCILLLSSQTLLPLAVTKRFPESQVTMRWIVKNRLNIIGAVIVMTFSPLSIMGELIGSISVPVFLPFLLLGFWYIELPILAAIIAMDYVIAKYEANHYKDLKWLQSYHLTAWLLLLVTIPIYVSYYAASDYGWYLDGWYLTIFFQLASVLPWAAIVLFAIFMVDSRVLKSKIQPTPISFVIFLAMLLVSFVSIFLYSTLLPY